MKKIAIIGRGTAGAVSASHFHRWTDCQIDWYFDPNRPTQAVGESTNLLFPRLLFNNLGFEHYDLPKIGGTYKRSIKKFNWGPSGKIFEHTFSPPGIPYHVDCLKLQDYVLNFFKNDPRVNVIPSDVTSHDQIDADYIMDCSGRPKTYDEFHISPYIPVNSTHVIQCYWNQPRNGFEYTLMVARPYGWVFGIPLQNRCSMGYMYNKDITSLEEVHEDLLKVIEEFELIPSSDNITFSFGNYYRKQNFSDRVAYNGNASFFLEPMEATSIGMMDKTAREAYDCWFNNKPINDCQKEYERHLKNTEHFVAMHYAAGSIYKNKFWDFAKEKGEKALERAVLDEEFMLQVETSKKYLNKHIGYMSEVLDPNNFPEFSFWWVGSFVQNFPPLGLYDKVDEISKRIKNG